ncbi:MAG: site-2 protease family protein [Firmicutes bacterium]|nr:site-2 protease family protein [Bacillota bacterium]MBQ9605151.1 site-2 protease family protein [Bacillota bacterium]
MIYYIERAVALLLCFYVFEMTKSVVSAIQGDPTPKQHKMLTLNIFKYFEPIGFLLGFFFGYGWGQPAPVAPRYYKDRKSGAFITYTAPIVVSVLLALAFQGIGLLIVKAAGNANAVVTAYVFLFFETTADMFVRLAIFNLIPIPPMCGSEIIRCFLTPNQAFKYGQNAPIFQMVFLMLWFFGLITPYLDMAVSAVENVLFALF